METPGTPLNEFMKGFDVEKLMSRAALLFFQFNGLLNQVSSIETSLSQIHKKMDTLMYRVRKIEKATEQ